MLGSFADVHSRRFRAKSRALSRLFHIFRESEDGQAVVELALVLPVLLVVVLGVVDFGRAVNYWNNDTHLANLAARYAAVGTLPTKAQDPTCGEESPMTEVTLIAYVKCKAGIDSSELENGSGKTTGAAALTVNVSAPASATVGSPVTVKVEDEYNWLPLPKVLGGAYPKFATTKLCGLATMRLEDAPSSSFSTTTLKCP